MFVVLKKNALIKILLKINGNLTSILSCNFFVVFNMLRQLRKNNMFTNLIVRSIKCKIEQTLRKI